MNSLAIYVHWPFCESKCPYCDFNSHVSAGVDYARWQSAYFSELEWFAARLPRRAVSSIYFGGGTPTLMPPSLAAAILTKIAEMWPVKENVEVTLEANPGSSEVQKFKAFRDAGFNRVSVGVQSLRQEGLAFLGRKHSVAQAVRAVEAAKNVFGNVNFDMIYARPTQTLAEWKAELGEALELADKHLSLYQLTIEKGTPFYARHEAGEFALPEEKLSARLFEVTRDLAASKGFEAYEVSNFAHPGFESRHNMHYWRYGEYVGVGPGAHGRVMLKKGRTATMAVHHPERWLQQVEDKGHGLQTRQLLGREEIDSEYILMSLRTREGCDLGRLAAMDDSEKDNSPVSSVNPPSLHGGALGGGDVLKLPIHSPLPSANHFPLPSGEGVRGRVLSEDRRQKAEGRGQKISVLSLQSSDGTPSQTHPPEGGGDVLEWNDHKKDNSPVPPVNPPSLRLTIPSSLGGRGFLPENSRISAMLNHPRFIRMEEEGLMTRMNGMVRATPEGVLLLNAITAAMCQMWTEIRSAPDQSLSVAPY